MERLTPTCVLALGHGRLRTTEPLPPVTGGGGCGLVLGPWVPRTPLPAQGPAGAKVKVRERGGRWRPEELGWWTREGPVCALCWGAGTEKRLPRLAPHPWGFPLLGFLGLPRWVGKGGVCREGAQRAWSSPCCPIRWGGQGPRCFGRGPDRPHPQAPCAQLFLSPPCLKAVKAQSAAGVSVQVGRSPEAPEAAPHPGLPDSSPGPPQALPQPLFRNYRLRRSLPREGFEEVAAGKLRGSKDPEGGAG